MSGLFYLCAGSITRPLHSLESQTSQPCFDFLHPVALDFDGPTGANANGVVPRIFRNGDLQNRSEFVEKDVSVARDLFDPCCHSSTVLSVMGWTNKNIKSAKWAKQTKYHNGWKRKSSFIRWRKSHRKKDLCPEHGYEFSQSRPVWNHGERFNGAISYQCRMTHRCSEYTGKNPSALLGLFLVRATWKG